MLPHPPSHKSSLIPRLTQDKTRSSGAKFALQSRAIPIASFTLIELLVVIAILAILAVAVVLILNPVELIKESRDTTRLTDLGVLHKGLTLLQTDQPNASFGSSTTVYVSIPWTATSSNCSNLGLPTLPSGYAYGCAPTSTYQKTDGTGWIPVNFASFSAGAPFSKLPVDPTNTTSTGLYYTYIPGGSWKLTALFESADRATVAGTDGGVDPAAYEVGSSLSLISPGRGLVGHWDFENSVEDKSGFNHNGTWNGTSTTRYVSGAKGSYAGTFNGSSDYVSIAYKSTLNFGGAPLSISAWVKPTTLADGSGQVIGMGWSGYGTWNFAVRDWAGVINGFYLRTGSAGVAKDVRPETDYFSYIVNGDWHHIAVVVPADLTNLKVYLDGNDVTSGATDHSVNSLTNTSSNVHLGAWSTTASFKGDMDDVRLYRRALSAAEISALYNATE